MNSFTLVIKYCVFATVATVLNLLTQELTVSLYNGQYGIYAAILAGTVTGLVCKFVLDKRYIFAARSNGKRELIGHFWAYTLTGGITTLLFWGFELGFDYWFDSSAARYAGAVIGLSIGYTIKYRLDKRYVFNTLER